MSGKATPESAGGDSAAEETQGAGLPCFLAIVGPSGCGKSTLLKELAFGDTAAAGGCSPVSGRGASRAYLPQFGAFPARLTVGEILEFASSLRLPRRTPVETRRAWRAHIVAVTGIGGLLGQEYRTLSGGERRRLALAEQLIGDPEVLFLDELTSGLDAYSDREMMLFLRGLAHDHDKTVVLVTHATYHLELCDRILLLHRGAQVFEGTYDELLESHGAGSVTEVLGMWKSADVDGHPVRTRSEKFRLGSGRASDHRGGGAERRDAAGGWAQFPVLLRRQLVLFGREHGQAWLHLALLLVFPAVVGVFAYRGLPQVRQLGLELERNVVKTMAEQLLYLRESFSAASLVSGLAMFQVVLLTLMGANNGAREIAREREVLAKERRVGLSPTAYVGSKFVQIALLCAAQAFWMAWFVKTVCGFPGRLGEQVAILFATVLAMSTVCLAISAASRSAERASLLSIYLVGFQLPLSGAALALPDWLAVVCRPFIAAYWGWSGYLRTLSETRHFDIVRQSTDTGIASFEGCMTVLALHVAIGLGLAVWFVRREEGREG